METPSALPPPPRLRISRLSQSSPLDTSQQAGPSRLLDSYSPIASHYLQENEECENQEDTPKLTASKLLPNAISNEHRRVEETPAERLKALLSLVPNDSTVKARRQLPLPQEPSSASTMDLVDSDSDIAQAGSAHPSVTYDSLKAIFARALRDPDTPQKGAGGRAKRRNSIDTSEVEASPRVEKIQRYRSSLKGKRRSMSDDEVDPSFKFSQTNESIKHSQASTFQLLRERLSASALRDQSISDVPLSDHSVDSDSFLRGLNSSHAPATSTPQHSAHNSLKMSVNSQFRSNLLDQDSEMQQAMNAFDSYEESRSHENGKPAHNSTALMAPNSQRGTDERGEDQGPHHKSKSDNNLSRVSFSNSSHHSHKTMDSKSSPSLHAFPRSASPATHASASSSRSRTKSDIMHEREHSWNRHQTKPATPDLKHTHSAHTPGLRSSSPVVHSIPRRTLSRHASNTSIGSIDSFDDSASQSGSVGSQSDYRDLLKQRSMDRNHDREREWNKPRSRTSSNASISSLNERARTHSIPSRPSSRLSISSPSFHHRRRSSSRAGSPTGSSMSIDSEVEREKEIQHEIEHERERNWNSPRPHWDHVRSRTNSDASVPDSPSPVPITPTLSPYLRKSTNSFRLRAESLKERSRSPGLPLSPPSVARPSSRLSSSKTSTHSHSPTISLKSPKFPVHANSPTRALKKDPSTSPVLSTPFPHSRAPLLDDSTSNIPSFRHHSRTLSVPSSSPQWNRNTRPSLIPTPSKGKGKEKQTPSPTEKRNGSFSSPSAIPMVAVDAIDNKIESQLDEVETTDTDDEGKLAVEKTPTIRPSFNLPSDSETEAGATVHAPIPNPVSSQHSAATMSMSLTEVYSPARLSKDEERLQKVLSSPDTSVDDTTAVLAAITSPPSPPPSPPSDALATPEEQPQHTFELPSTPPRRSSFSSTSLPLQTPTPPKGLSELPDPPSFDDGTDSAENDHELKNVNTTALKTPKPPGAWSYTPAPQRQNGLLRSQSLPQLDEEPQHDNGLATPVSSLSRASSVPPKTPALPGGWMPTPYPKSVRFEKEESVSTDQSALVSDSSVEPESNLKYASERLKQQLDMAKVETSGEVKVRSPGEGTSEKDASTTSMHTPPPSNPVSPSSKSPRTKGRINILDEYGREIPDEGSESKMKREKRSSPRSSVRILDAMGREVDDTRSEDMTTVNENDEPLSRTEALSRLREGLHDLAQGFEEAIRYPVDESFTQGRIKELKADSEHARQTRKRLQRRVIDEEDLKKNFIEPLRASMRRSKITTPIPPLKSSFSWLPPSWLWSIFLAQIILIFIMYRISVSHATHYFLTTYYDPYYPDLYLYQTTPDYPPPLSVTEVFWHEGILASVWQMLNNVLIVISRLHTSAWRLWGADDLHRATTWPPT